MGKPFTILDTIAVEDTEIERLLNDNENITEIRIPTKSERGYWGSLIDSKGAGIILGVTSSSAITILKQNGIENRYSIIKQNCKKLGIDINKRSRCWYLKIDVLELKQKRLNNIITRNNATKEHRAEIARRWKEHIKEYNLCRYCGKPSSSVRKGVCDEHLEKVRNNQRIYNKRKSEQGLCIYCRKVPKRLGYETCAECGDKLNVVKRERNLKNRLARVDALIDNGLISVSDATLILHCCREQVRRYINKGLITIQEKAFKTVFVKEDDVRLLASLISLGKTLPHKKQSKTIHYQPIKHHFLYKQHYCKKCEIEIFPRKYRIIQGGNYCKQCSITLKRNIK